MDNLFLPISENDFENEYTFFDSFPWWSVFASKFKCVPSIEEKISHYNGTMIRCEKSSIWLGIQFKTEKDKLFFMLKFVK